MGVSLFFSSPDYFSEVSGRAIGLLLNFATKVFILICYK